MVNLYKNTIIASATAALLSIICAIICEIIIFPHNLLLQNFMVGIACSLLVVIITSILQYNHEHKCAFHDYSAALRKLILYLSFVYPDLEEMQEEKYYNKFYNELDQSFESLVKADKQLCWFSSDKEKKQRKIRSIYAQMWIAFTKGYCASKKAAVKSLVKHNCYLPLINATKELLTDKTDNKLLDAYMDTALSALQEEACKTNSEAGTIPAEP